VKKLFFIWLLVWHNLYALEVNECNSDVYFANGINTDEITAKKSRDKISKKTKISFPEAYKYVANWKVSYNHTHGIGIDLYESFLQKIYEDEPGTSLVPFIWNLDEIADYFVFSFRGIVRKIVKKAPRETIKKYAAGAAKKLARKVVKVYNNKYGKKLTEEQIEAMFNDLYDYLIEEGTNEYLTKTEEEIIKQEQEDVTAQEINYIRSIAQGHRVIIVAHSQGNLFTNRVYEDFKIGDVIYGFAWMRQYIDAIGVATPANNVIGADSPYLTFDNDMIQLVPDSLPSNVTNPKRYHIYNGIDEDLGETIYSIKAHSFLSSYMATDITRNAILGFIEQKIEEHKKSPSQWKKDRNFGCLCKEKSVSVKHKFLLDKSYAFLNGPELKDIKQLFIEMSKQKIKNFTGDNEGKIYPVNGQYVRAACNGTIIEEIEQDDACYVLKDDASNELGTIEGPNRKPEGAPGVVEIELTWDRPELDYDLVVEWDAGEVDIKDTGCALEHFHVKREKDIFPGRYRVFIKPKDPADDSWDDPQIYPLKVTMKTTMPGRPETLEFNIKERGDIFLGHVADIDVTVVSDRDDRDGDVNSTDSGSGSSDTYAGSGNSSLSSGPAFIISSQIAPECPPVIHTPSPLPPQPIVFRGPGSGGWSWHTSGSAGYSSVSSNSGKSYTPGRGKVYPTLLSPECSGDIDCLPKPDDMKNPESGSGTLPDYLKDPLIPIPPEVGGRPLPKMDKNDSCDLSCGCIPCEYTLIPYKKQIYFGPLRSADFSIYTLDGYLKKESIFDGKTTNGNTLYDAGEIELPFEFLRALDDDRLYIIEARGGEDIDSDDDFIIDANPTINNGKVYAIASGKDIKESGLKINILTTVTFILVEKSVLERKGEEEIKSEIEEIAQRLLARKIYPVKDGGGVNNEDLLAWLPTIDKDLLLREYRPLEEMVQDIYSGKDIYNDAYYYVFYTSPKSETSQGSGSSSSGPAREIDVPIIKSFSSTVPENAEGGTVIGKMEVLHGNIEDIRFGNLHGKGSELFEISEKGVIKLKDDAALDYETKWLYNLEVKAFDKKGASGSVAVYISVKNIPDAPEYAGYEGLEVKEDATPGTIVGQILFDSVAAPIDSIELIGESSDKFTIDKEGVIRLAEGEKLDYEKKYSYGFWAVAKNRYGSSIPVILHINVIDTPDSPRILNYNGGYVSENAPAGTVVGRIVFDKGGADIDEILIEGFGSQNFTVDTDGVIRVAENASLDYEKYILYRPVVTIKNRYGSASKTIFISITNTNDVPSFLSFSGGNVKENSPAGTVAAKITFDAGSMPIESISLTGYGSEKFRILKDGTILTTEELDYEQRSRYTLKAVASNAFGDSLPVTVHIFVDDVTEIAAELDDFVVNDIPEDSEIGTTIGKIEVLNEGSGPIERFEITGDGSDKFTVDVNGNVSIAKKLDYEKRSVYNLKVKAKNRAGFGNEANLVVRLKDIPDIPPSITGFTIKVKEDAAVNTIVGRIKAVREGDTPIYRYILKGDGSEKFAIDGNGTVRVAEENAFDFEKIVRYDLILSALNRAGESNLVTLQVEVENVPEIVPVVDNGVLSVNENSPEGTAVGTVHLLSWGDTAVDSFVITNEANTTFVIDEKGVVRVGAGADLDFERRRSYTLTVKAHNGAGYSNEALYTVNIKDIPDTVPVLSYAGISEIDENLTMRKVVGKISYLPKELPLKSISLSGDGSEKFDIDINGTIYAKESAGFDYEKKRWYILHVTATNEYGKGEPLDISVVVKDIAGLNARIDENSPGGTVVGRVEPVGFKETDTVDFRIYGDGSENFTIDNDGTLKIKEGAKIDYEARSSYRFYAEISDKKGISNTEFLNIDVNNLPDEPLIEADEFFVEENAPEGTVIGKIAILREGDSKISGFDLGFNNYDIQIDKNGTIRVGAQTPLDYEKERWFGFHVNAYNENGNRSNSIFVRVNVTNMVNEPPTLKKTVLYVDENSAPGTAIGAVGLKDSGGTDLTEFELSGSGSEKFAVDRNGYIAVADNAVLDYEEVRSYSLKATASNIYGQSAPVDVAIIINNIPEVAPVLKSETLEVKSGTGEYAKIAELLLNSADIDSYIESVSIFGEGSEDFFVQKGNVALYVAPGVELNASRRSSYSFRITATNGAGTSEAAELNITVLPLDTTPPVVTLNGGQSMTLSLFETFTDPGAVAYDETDGKLPVSVEGKVDTSVSGTYTLVYSAKDKYGNTGKSVRYVHVTRPFGRIRCNAIADATVKIYEITNDSNLTLKWTETGSNGESLDEVGVFDTHSEEVDPEKYYLFEVSGGLEMDSDLDGKIDSNSSENFGKIRAVARGSDIIALKSEFTISIASEIFYRRIVGDAVGPGAIPALQSLYFYEDQKADKIASFIVEDIDADSDTDLRDLLRFDPYRDPHGLKGLYAETYERMSDNLRKGEDPFAPLLSQNQYRGSKSVNTINTAGVAYMGADYSTDLFTVSLSDKESPAVLNTLPLAGRVNGTIYSDSEKLLYVNTLSGDLYIISVADPHAPVKVGEILGGGFCSGIAVDTEKELLYGVCGKAGMKIVDISDSTNPKTVTTVDFNNTIGYVSAMSKGSKDNIFYLTSDKTLTIIELGADGNFTLLSSVDLPDYAENITLSADENFAYIPIGLSGTAVVDIGDKTAPSLLNTIYGGGYSKSVTVTADGKKAYISDGDKGIFVVGIDGGDVTELTKIATVESVVDTALSKDGQYLYAIESSSGATYFETFDVSDLDNVIKAGSTTVFEDPYSGLE